MKKYALKIAGAIWLLIGFFLLSRGCSLLYPYISNETMAPEKASGLFHAARHFMLSNTEIIIIYICIALSIGFLKARSIFRRIVDRNIARIDSFKGKFTVIDVFARKDYIVMMCMMLLGMFIRLLDISPDIRGGILIAVGSALIQGALFYFQEDSKK